MAFSTGMPSPRRDQKPLSITAVGLYMLFGACLMPINILAHGPAFLLGLDFAGWRAVVFFVAIGTFDLVIGIGLLRFAAWSRGVAIYFFVFRITNTLMTLLLPGSRARFEVGLALMRASLGKKAGPRSTIWFGGTIELIAMGLVLWILFRRKDAFLSTDPGPAPAR